MKNINENYRSREESYCLYVVTSVDSFCIDKRNSANLTEAINSMFRWYECAQCCYAYLADVPVGYSGPKLGSEDAFLQSRWFSRGWTLQELIAPKRIAFFAQDWTEFGTKETLRHRITLSTGIPNSILLDSSNLEETSVAERMSWASRQETTREEDVAYCLIGLFNVSMPMIYGEGNKAFEHLQLEIIKSLYDQSIFAWKAERSSNNLLATSPTDFADAGDIVKFDDSRFMWPYSMTHLGLSIRLPFLNDTNGHLSIAFTNCGYKRTSTSKEWIAIFLERDDKDLYHRVKCNEVFLSHGPQDLKLNPFWCVRDHNYTVDSVTVFYSKGKKAKEESLHVTEPDSPISQEHKPPRADDFHGQAEKKGRFAKFLFANNISIGQQVKAVLFPHWITMNWLLIAVPIGIALNYMHAHPLALYIVNTIAVMPLATILSFAVEEIALQVDQGMGAVLNAIFG
jgi:hypothetical protein